MHTLKTYVLGGLVFACALTSSLFGENQKIILGENFAKAQVSIEETDQLTVGDITFYSVRKVLSIVEIEGGKKVLCLRSGGQPNWVRFGFAPVAPTPQDTLIFQFRFQFPDGAPDKNGAMRIGLYNLADVTNTEATLPTDQGFWVQTNPGCKDGNTDTKFVCDNNSTGSNGRWPGFLGGGLGSAICDKAAEQIDIGSLWATSTLSVRPIPAKGMFSWQLDYSLINAGARLTLAQRVKENKNLPITEFNTAGFYIAPKETVYVDTIAVSVLSK